VIIENDTGLNHFVTLRRFDFVATMVTAQWLLSVHVEKYHLSSWFLLSFEVLLTACRRKHAYKLPVLHFNGIRAILHGESKKNCAAIHSFI